MKRMNLYLCILSLIMCTPVTAQAGSGAVYAMTNPDLAANQIVVYRRAVDGRLTLIETVETGGNGYVIAPGDALSSQGSLILSPDNRWLFAVNAGTDPSDADSASSISVFGFNNDDPTDLSLVDCGAGGNPIASGGNVPVSLTIHRDLLYVLHAGGAGDITGFTMGHDGCLTPLVRSTVSLGNPNVPAMPRGMDFLDTPAQVGFTPVGHKLVVTVKGARSPAGEQPHPQIHVFDLDDAGRPKTDTTIPMINVPVAFVFDSLGNVIVTEPFGRFFFPAGPPLPPGFLMSGAVSSYQDQIAAEGTLILNSTVGNGQLATCWIAITTQRLFNFAYASNIATNTISSYLVDSNGRLLLLDGAAADLSRLPGGDRKPVDLAISPDNKYLYNVNTQSGTVTAFRINKNGSLTLLQEIGGLPSEGGSAVGIAVR